MHGCAVTAKREPIPGLHLGKRVDVPIPTLDALDRLKKAIRLRDRIAREQNRRENRLRPTDIEDFIKRRGAAEQALLRARADLDELLREE